MKNSLTKFTNKILFQDKVLKILICMVLVLLPTAFSVWCAVVSASAIWAECVLLKFSVIYLTAFMFISYEYIYKLESVQLAECVNATPKGTQSIIKSKTLLLCTLAAIEAIALVLIITAFAISEGAFTAQYFTYIVISVFLNVFLLSTVGIFMGAFAAIKMKKIPAYVMMIFMTIMSSRVLDILWIGLSDATNLNIFKITGLFELTAPSTNWAPNTAFGFSFLPYRFAVLLLWIIVSLLGIVLSLNKIDKRKIKAAICIILAASCLAVHFAPASKVIMNQRNTESSNADYEYYCKHSDEIISKKADFNITDLSIKASANLKLNATAEIKVDSKALDKYRFTLYHGYKIKNVKINNKTADFDRQSDYLEIRNNQNTVDIITIDYSGYSSRYYSNIQGSILPGYFSFYPVAGYCEIYNVDYQSFMPAASKENINFDVKISSVNKFFSNLDETEKNHFKGSAKSLTLVSGLYKEIVTEDIRVVYPYTDTEEMSAEVIEKHIKNFKKSNVDNGSIKTIIVLPNLNQGKYETVYSNDDYIISQWVVNLQEDYVKSLINPSKQELYACLDSMLNNTEEYKETKEYYAFIALFEEALDKYDKNAFYEECNKYLFNSDDDRTIEEFLSDLKEAK